MNPIDLKTFCNPDRPAISEPFSEGDMTYYTDGRIIIRVPRDPSVPEREDAPKNMKKILFGMTDAILTIPLSKLELPGIEGDPNCANCGGCGKCNCSCGNYHECGKCNGTGKGKEKPKGVDFGKHRLNHILLHKIKKILGNVVLLEYDHIKTSPVGFTFDGGEGRLAPLSQD